MVRKKRYDPYDMPFGESWVPYLADSLREFGLNDHQDAYFDGDLPDLLDRSDGEQEVSFRDRVRRRR